jgi:hypothetical protein
MKSARIAFWETFTERQVKMASRNVAAAIDTVPTAIAVSMSAHSSPEHISQLKPRAVLNA